MKILAFDQATEKTGVALFDDSTLNMYELIDLHREKNSEERKRKMILSVISVMQETNPDTVVIEDVSFQKNAASLIYLARLQGAIIGWCISNGKDVVIYKPTSWRKILNFKQGSAVKRSALKEQAQEFVKNYYGVEPSEDEADAIAIGCAYICASGLIKGFEGKAKDA